MKIRQPFNAEIQLFSQIYACRRRKDYGLPVVARDTLIWFQVDIKIFMRFSYQAVSEAVE